MEGALAALLAKEAEEVWVLGDAGKAMVEELRELLIKAARSGKKRMRLIFYLDDPRRLDYLNLLRAVLVENTSMSIIVEEKPRKTLEHDLKNRKERPRIIPRELISDPLKGVDDLND